MIYLWLKVIHILAVISWMAGLFYLPRLFVYHTKQVVGSDADALFKLMERRLMKVIMRPAAFVALIAGIATAYAAGMGFGEEWLLLKLVGVAGLFFYHGLLEVHLASLARGERLKSERYYRFINEVPTLLLIWIVILVVIKPFS